MDRRELQELYGRALDQARFQVELNWDRTKFFVVVNAGLLAAAVALFRWVETPLGAALVAVTFTAGSLTAILGVAATKEGKRYHRAASVRKVLLEARLGLWEEAEEGASDHASLAVGGAMTRAKAHAILADPDAYVNTRVRTTSVTGSVVGLLWVLAATDALGAAASIYLAFGCPGGGGLCGA